MNERCETCRFWLFPDDEPCDIMVDPGICMRGPPLIGENGFGEFPLMFSDDWCGEYQPKKDADQCSE